MVIFVVQLRAGHVKGLADLKLIQHCWAQSWQRGGRAQDLRCTRSGGARCKSVGSGSPEARKCKEVGTAHVKRLAPQFGSQQEDGLYGSQSSEVSKSQNVPEVPEHSVCKAVVDCPSSGFCCPLAATLNDAIGTTVFIHQPPCTLCSLLVRCVCVCSLVATMATNGWPLTLTKLN